MCGWVDQPPPPCMSRFSIKCVGWYGALDKSVTPPDSWSEYMAEGPRHEWQATPKDRATRGAGCPFCGVLGTAERCLDVLFLTTNQALLYWRVSVCVLTSVCAHTRVCARACACVFVCRGMLAGDWLFPPCLFFIICWNSHIFFTCLDGVFGWRVLNG